MIEQAIDALKQQETKTRERIRELRAELLPLEGDLLRVVTAIATLEGSPPPTKDTIQDFVLEALRTTFRDGGATNRMISEYILNQHQRVVSRNSLSPQLSRMQANSIIKNVDGFWQIVPDRRT